MAPNFTWQDFRDPKERTQQPDHADFDVSSSFQESALMRINAIQTP